MVFRFINTVSSPFRPCVFKKTNLSLLIGPVMFFHFQSCVNGNTFVHELDILSL